MKRARAKAKAKVALKPGRKRKPTKLTKPTKLVKRKPPRPAKPTTQIAADLGLEERREASAPEAELQCCRCGDGPTPGNFICATCIMTDRQDAEVKARNEGYMAALVDIDDALKANEAAKSEPAADEPIHRELRQLLKVLAQKNRPLNPPSAQPEPEPEPSP